MPSKMPLFFRLPYLSKESVAKEMILEDKSSKPAARAVGKTEMLGSIQHTESPVEKAKKAKQKTKTAQI